MWVTVNEMIVAFALLLNFYRLQSAWYLSVPWQLHKVVCDDRIIFTVPLGDVINFAQTASH